MRKSLGAFMLIMVLFVSLAAVSFAKVNHEGIEVEIKENVLYGEKSAAEGLKVQIPVTNNSRLFWDTDYLVGENPTAETEFTFYQNSHQEYSGGSRDGFELVLYNGGGSSMSGGGMDLEVHAPYGMEKMFIDVADRTAAGEEHTEEVRFVDYYDDYLLSGEVILNGGICIGDHGMLTGEEALEDGNAMSYLVGQYKIPVPETCMVSITIRKNTEGEVTGYNYNLIDGDLGQVACFSAVTSDTLYYAVDIRMESEDGSQFPVEGMEDWHGIYRMTYRVIEGDYNEYVEADLEEIERVLPLDPEVVILEMQASEDGDKMLLFTAENGMCVLNVIDLGTMAVLQKLELMPYEGSPVSRDVIEGEDVLVWLLSDDTMAVITEQENGGYSLEFSTALSIETISEDMAKVYLSTDRMSVDYDGEKLAIVYPLGYYYYKNVSNSCTFWLMVYDGDGLRYCGEYQASQGIGESYSSRNCLIRDDVKMEVTAEQ